MTTQFTACSSCNGTGVVTAEYGIHTCPTCTGSGGAFLINGMGATLSLPSFYTTSSGSLRQAKLTSQRIAAYSSIAVFAIGILLALLPVTRTAGSVLYLIGVYATLFYGGPTLLSLRKSTYELSQLSDNPPSTELLDYANQRFVESIESAASVAIRSGSQSVEPQHFLSSLLSDSHIRILITRAEIATSEMIQQFSISPDPNTTTTSAYLSASSRELLATAVAIAIENQLPFIDSEDILLALLKDPSIASALAPYGLTYQKAYSVSRWYAWEEAESAWWKSLTKNKRIRPKGKMNKAWSALPTPLLDTFSRDLTSRVAPVNIALVRAREKQITETLASLGRIERNSVVLRSEDGLSTQLIINEIALRMIQENVPDPLRDKRLVEIDIATALTSSNQPEQLLQQLLQEIAQAGNIILVLPNIEMLVSSSKQSLDTASLLASAIQKGILQVLSTASYGDYRRYVESSSSLKEMLTAVTIPELTPGEALEVLQIDSVKIENQYNLGITFPALESAVTLASKLISDPPLPQSAINLLDQAASQKSQAGGRLVTVADIELLITQKTGVPPGSLTDNDRAKLLGLSDEMRKRVVGQGLAITLIAQSIQRSRAGLHTSNRPVSSFLFIGPTGVGKTETAKALASLYFGSEEKMIRLDMSEYQNPESVYQLIGAPSLSSNELTEGGMLTKAVRENPFSLVLLDEFEKAHPDVLNLFLQVLDDGRLTENTGRTVKFSNSIIIATSNAGVKEISQLSLQGLTPEDFQKQSLEVLRSYYKPELINRFDAVVPFSSLTRAHVLEITRHSLEAVSNSLLTQGYQIEFSDDAIQLVADHGYNPEFGARPIRRAVQDIAESRIAQFIIENRLPKDTAIEITASMLQ